MAFHYAIIYGNALKQAHYTLFCQTMQYACMNVDKFAHKCNNPLYEC